jgi:Protein of unknown function (DUF3828)
MRRLALTLLLLAIATPAFAFDTPKALLQALYAPYSKGDSFDWSKWDEAKFRSKALNTLFAADEKEANGDIGRLDFDPYIDGQDYQITALKIGDAKIVGTTATAEVTFKNFDNPEDMTFTLLKEADGWKIDDVASSGTEYPYSLKAIMEAPMPTGDESAD